MPPPLKQIKNRLRSIENTRKVTAAMEMISAAKLNRVDKLLYPMRPYLLKLESVLSGLLSLRQEISHPFLEERAGGKKCLCLITSDTGLCSSYNNNIIRMAEDFIAAHGRENVELVCVGKKGYNYFYKEQCQVIKAYLGMHGRYVEAVVEGIVQYLSDIFISYRVNSVYIAYTHYQSVLAHKPLIVKFLNLPRAGGEKLDYLLEPDLDGILARVLPKYISMKLRLIFMEAFTAEHSARTLAMKTATDNADDLLRGLILLRNKVRQANITAEIMEIIASSEALKG